MRNPRPALLSLLKVLPLLLGVGPSALAWAALTSPGLDSCHQAICAQSKSVASFADFLALANDPHPDLEGVLGRYRERIELLRQGRLRQARESLEALRHLPDLESRLQSLTDPDLLTEFLASPRWNIEEIAHEGQRQLSVDPLTRNPLLSPTVVAIAKRSLDSCPIYRASLEVFTLGRSIPEALRLPAQADWHARIGAQLQARIEALTQTFRPSLLKLHQEASSTSGVEESLRELMRLEKWAKLELLVAVREGAIRIAEGERTPIIALIAESLSSTLRAVKLDDSLLDSFYSAPTWERTCRQSFNRKLHYAVTAAEKQTLQSLLKDGHQATENTLLRLFDAGIARSILERIRKMTIVFPLSREESFRLADERLEQEISRTRSSLSPEEQARFIRSIRNSSSSERDPILDEALSSVCPQEWPGTDMATQFAIQLSSYSAKHPLMGLYTVVHELGHAVSYALKEREIEGKGLSSFREIRSCISSTYADSTARPKLNIHFEGDRFWTEEDWADAFSAYALRDHGFNTGCGFRDGFGDGLLSLEWTEKDAHSPNPYRIPFVHVQAGNSLPPVCGLALEHYAPKMPRESCLLRAIRTRSSVK